jgi:GntR family L-lactate dehydrogenase operon transcriptional regulator
MGIEPSSVTQRSRTLAKQRVESEILEILAEAQGPIGSASIQDSLVDLGWNVSEPTVGRALHRLDRRRYTKRISNKGRVLTESGQRYLAGLRREAERARLEDRLLDAAKASNLAHLIDVLATRRVLERETARLAAINATDADVARLEAFVASQGDDGVKPGLHSLVAQIAGNQVMEAALQLISHDEDLHRKLRAALSIEGELLRQEFNRRIVDAIRSRDPKAASQAMDDHLTRVIDAVQRASSQLDAVDLVGIDKLGLASI